MAALAYPARTLPANRPRRAAVAHLRVSDPSTPSSVATGAIARATRAQRAAEPWSKSEFDAPLVRVVAFPSSAATRRRFARRRVAVVVSVATFFAALWIGSGLLVAAGTPPLDVLPGSVATAQGYRYVVQPGDTVWSIASRLQPTGDVRPLVDRLDASFGGSVLHAGETVLVP